jgi:hypothetical protein
MCYSVDDDYFSEGVLRRAGKWDKVSELLDRLCECKDRYVCVWHRRLSSCDDASVLEAEMVMELDTRHYEWVKAQGWLDPDEDEQP